MTAWRENQHSDFSFQDAHDLNTALDSSQPDTIRRRLRERLKNTRQAVMLLGDDTRQVAGRSTRFLYHEVEVILKLGLPIVFSNLNGSRESETNRMPVALQTSYTLSVSFQPKILQKALDDWVERYPTEKLSKSGPHFYKANVYADLDL